MRQKITVYGLRFSKTTFWNCLNTGFLEPAVATALTARGIETIQKTTNERHHKHVATALTARGIETSVRISFGAKSMVATALTARGIETSLYSRYR